MDYQGKMWENGSRMNSLDENPVNIFVDEVVILSIMFCVLFLVYLVACFHFKTCCFKALKPKCDWKYSKGIYTVSNFTSQRVSTSDCDVFPFYMFCGFPFYLIQLICIVRITAKLTSQVYMLPVIILEICALNVLLCCYVHGEVFDSKTSCEEIIQEIRKQKVELLSSIDGILQPFISPAYHYEDLSFLITFLRQIEEMEDS